MSTNVISKIGTIMYHIPLRNYILFFIGVIVFLVLFYFIKKYIKNQRSQYTLLIDSPIYLNKETTLGTYYTLNSLLSHDSGYNYNYAISCWVFLDSAPPSVNQHYGKDCTILNYGGNPHLFYNATKNTISITMTKGQGTLSTIVYRKNNILLQKWNPIIINYHGGTLDIFYNGELAKSVLGVVPYMTTDTLQVGTENGLYGGGISKLIYYQHNLDAGEIEKIHRMPPPASPYSSS